MKRQQYKASNPESSSRFWASNALHHRAFNSTTLTTLNIDSNALPVIHLFYQDYEARIRRLQKSGTQQLGKLWSGAPEFPAIVTTDVKNATPLACVNYTNPITELVTVSSSVLQIARKYAVRCTTGAFILY